MVNIAWELGLNEDWEGQSRTHAHIWSALIGLGIARWLQCPGGEGLGKRR